MIRSYITIAQSINTEKSTIWLLLIFFVLFTKLFYPNLFFSFNSNYSLSQIKQSPQSHTIL